MQNSVVSPFNAEGIGSTVNVRSYDAPEQVLWDGFVGLTRIVNVSLVEPVFKNNRLIAGLAPDVAPEVIPETFAGNDPTIDHV